MNQSVLVFGLRLGERTNVHVDFSGEEFSTWWMKQQYSLQQVQGRNYQEIVLSIAPFAHQSLEAGDQPHGNIALK